MRVSRRPGHVATARCRSDLAERLFAHVIAVNEVDHLPSDSAQRAYVTDAYTLAHATHVVVQAMSGWRINGETDTPFPELGSAEGALHLLRLLRSPVGAA